MAIADQQLFRECSVWHVHSYSPVRLPALNAQSFGIRYSFLRRLQSAYYFNDGPFAHELSGALTLDANGPDGANRVAAYRVHDGRDALVFSDGFRLTWRVGDQTDTATGLKCTCPPGKAGCTSAGNPQPSNVTTLAWVYTW